MNKIDLCKRNSLPLASRLFLSHLLVVIVAVFGAVLGLVLGVLFGYSFIFQTLDNYLPSGGLGVGNSSHVCSHSGVAGLRKF